MTESTLGRLYKKAFEKIKSDMAVNDIYLIEEKYLDGYYIFNTGKNSVVHFKIKGCKNWLFGCWFSYDEDNKSYPIKAEIFCQHERYLNKFKPSRGTYCINTSITIMNDSIDFIDAGFIYQFIKIYRFIHRYPYLAYYKDISWACDYNYEKQRPVRSFFRYYKDGFRDWWHDLICNYLDNKLLKFVKKYASSNFSQYNWDILDEGEDCSPRYTLQVELPDGDEQETGLFSLFDTDEDQIAWNDLNLHCQKISDICHVLWYSSSAVSDCVVFWNRKEFEEYKQKLEPEDSENSENLENIE